MFPSWKSSASPAGRARLGFTLIELLVSMTILIAIMTIILGLFSGISRTWLQATRLIDSFQGARAGFDRMTRLLSQATLNVYTGYDNSNTPTVYLRQSELAFDVLQAGSNGVSGDAQYGTGTGNTNTGAGTGHAVFFQIPAGMYTTTAQSNFQTLSQTLCSIGFSVRLVGDDTFRPTFLNNINGGTRPVTSRMRLMEYVTPSDQVTFYNASTPANATNSTTINPLSATPLYWIDTMAGPSQPTAPTAYQYPVADNIVWMCIWPKLTPTDTTLAPTYVYFSRNGTATSPQPVTQNQLPPLVQVTMVAIDERSAERFPGATFTTQISPSFSGTLANVSNYQADINQVTNALTKNRISYRVFTTTVQMRESRWSQ